jgi:hypothetical protein
MRGFFEPRMHTSLDHVLMPEPDMKLSPGETTRLAAVEASAQSATATQADVPPAGTEVATAKEAAQQPKAEADGQGRRSRA